MIICLNFFPQNLSFNIKLGDGFKTSFKNWFRRSSKSFTLKTFVVELELDNLNADSFDTFYHS